MVDRLRNGWFQEVSGFWPGQAQSLEVEEVLWDKQSDFQHVLVFQSKAWGKVFCLDGAIQICDKDEFSYHENMAHIPSFAHPTGPKDVLIIGGGDGGVAREVLKHPTVETVTLCDIDAMVIEIAKLYFPKCACSFDDPKLKVNIGDGFAFMEGKKQCYDVIIVDSSDPDGPASTLFNKEFFTRCKEALRPNGILCTQAENMWIHTALIKKMITFIREVGFGSVEYASIQTPSYPSGSIGFFLCTENGTSCKEPAREPDETTQESLQYYTPDMHRSAFLLPAFMKRAVA